MEPATLVTTEQLIRARHMKLFLRCIEALDPSPRETVLGALPSEDLALVNDSGPMVWLPVDVNARATEVVWSALGKREREAFFLRVGVADFDSSLFNTTLAGAIRLFGVEPARILKWTPRAWPQLYRDSTRIKVFDAQEGSLRIRFEDLPPRLAGCNGWMDSVACSMSALFNVIGRTGAAAVELGEPAQRRMTLRFRWQSVG